MLGPGCVRQAPCVSLAFLERCFFDGDTMILERNMTGTVIGERLGIPGNGWRVTFRILHVFGFRDGLISREQVWIDSGAIVAQLTSS
jgi:predicted ester cyclase